MIKYEIIKNIKKNLINLPTPSRITYMWNFGSILAIIISIQIISGIILSIQFTANPEISFQNYYIISKNIWMGFLIKYLHSTIVSIIFTSILIHIYRNIKNISIKNLKTWNSGRILLLIIIITAFIGYVLPWGQISIWGATVICNIISSIPIIGKKIVFWIWGNYSVSKPTLNRFITFHFILPLLIAIIIIIHIILLHSIGSSLNSNINPSIDKISFKKKFYFKDLNSILLILIISSTIILSNPQILIDSENFNPANPLVTPIHIIPEWYFLFAYTILRSIPNKLGGVIIIILRIIIIFLIPKIKIINKRKFNPKIKTKNKIKIITFFILTFLGSKTIEKPFIYISIFITILYFPIILV